MRKVPTWLMEQLLGDEKTKDSGYDRGLTKKGDPKKSRAVQKKTVLRRGRDDMGQKNPRGGRYKSEDIQQQLTGPLGSHGEEGAGIKQDIVKKIMAAERGKNFNRDDVLRRIEAKEAGKKVSSKQKMLKGKKRVTVEEEPDEEPDDDEDD